MTTSPALSALATWFGQPESEIRMHVLDRELHYLSSIMQSEPMPSIQRWLRQLIGRPLARLPGVSRRHVTTTLKRLRNPGRGLPVRDIASFPTTQLMRRLSQKFGVPNGFHATQGILCVSHDVDDKEGWQVVSEMTKIDAAAGLRTTFNVLVDADYELEPDMLRQIRMNGHEIGLHGWTHDIGLSYRPPQFIERILRMARQRLPEATGFRSPALSVSQDLFRGLEQVGFQYDSSLQVGCTFYKSVEICIPYKLPGFNLWEIPLLVQDDLFFRDAAVEESQIFSILASLFEAVQGYGGVAVINLHPHLMADRLDFYKKLASWLGCFPGMFSLTTAQVMQQMFTRISYRDIKHAEKNCD